MKLMSEQTKFTKLFEPVQIGSLKIKNRIVMPSMANALATPDGYAGDQVIDYFEERAKGGVGLIIVGYACVDFPRGIEGPRRLAIDDDKYILGLGALAGAIKKHGARAAIQLNHAGGSALRTMTGFQPVAPSAIICRAGGDICRALTVPEIGQIVERFVSAAERAVRAGFEGVEIHAATGYLLNEFLSPYYNKRRDDYGGPFENRARFLMEVVNATRKRLGPDFPLWVRVNGREYVAGTSITIEDTQKLAAMLERAGMNAIHVTYYGYMYPFMRTAEPPGAFLHLTASVKKVVKIPVIGVGRITPEAGEQALQEGKADLVAMARGLLADPELPNKVAAGRLEDIVPCITCLACGSLCLVGEGACSVNPALGKEREYRITPVQKPKRVMVIGGGPAGMEAARVAALRGHKVTLYEKENRLGGRLRPGWQVRLAARLIHEPNILSLTKYLAAQMSKAGVEVVLGKEVTAALVKEVKPDVVVLAAGSKLSPGKRFVEMGIALMMYARYRDVIKKELMLRDRANRLQMIGPHTVMLAASRPNLGLLGQIGGAVPEVYTIGDCLEPFGIMAAMADGGRIGRLL